MWSPWTIYICHLGFRVIFRCFIWGISDNLPPFHLLGFGGNFSAIPPFLRTPTRELLRPDNFFQLVIFGLVWMMRQLASLTSLLRVTDHKYRIRRQVQNFWYSLYVFLEDTFDELFSKITLRCFIAHFSEKSKSSKYSWKAVSPPPSGKTMKNYVTSATLYAITQCLYIYLVIII